MKVLILSCSLNPNSRSFILATQMKKDLKGSGADTQLLDLREYPLDFADGVSARDNHNASILRQEIESADAILMAVPIYNFDVNALAKNVIEVTGRVWNDKLVGFMCAAGGRASYMSVMGIANSLMLDFRCLIIPRFIYATKGDFSDTGDASVQISSVEIKDRLAELASTTVKLATVLNNHTS